MSNDNTFPINFQPNGIQVNPPKKNKKSKDGKDKSQSLQKLEPPTYAIVDAQANEMRKPLCLIHGKAYAATWQKIEETTTEEIDDDGKVVKFDPPKKRTFMALVIISEDGEHYYVQALKDQLGIEVDLKDPLMPESKWSAKGVNQFLEGNRPNPISVFNQLVETVDHFIDFHKSLANQKTMCEFIACWILTTWFLDAFNVIGYPWINGEKGSGKTNLLMLLADLSYLGFFISPSGSFASLRDMADYGATVCCDDAENITDPKKTDPDKMALLLAGNRKGLLVPLKEQGPNKKWHTRFVNAYSGRAFSAIRVPDSTLASRCIILPLLRTPNRGKGNIDPMDHEEWPHNRELLIDDLWALALTYLSKLPEFDKWVGKNAKLMARNLQPWRAILAIAKWLEISGIQEIYDRMENLSQSYQNERPELEIADTTRVVIQALCECAVSAILAKGANKNIQVVILQVVDITEAAKKIVEEGDVDLNPQYIVNRWVGRVLTKLRFPEVPRPGGKGSRLREIDLKDLAHLAESYKVDFYAGLLQVDIPFDDQFPVNGTNGTNGSNGIKNDNVAETLGDATVVSCFTCGKDKFWQRPDGEWICGTCHPDPNDNNNKNFSIHDESKGVQNV